MKKTVIFRNIGMLILTAMVFSCASSPFINQTSSGPLYTGDGGSGMSLAVLIPEARGLTTEQNYLPTLVQGVLVGDLAKYSAISVLDRLTLESVLRETESGIYRSEADFGRLGQITNVDYVLTGSVTRTGSGYAVQIQVVGTGSGNIGVTKASHSGSFSIAELDNFTGIRRASLDLLTQMGVSLTDAAKRELSGSASGADVNAQRALSRGIVAQQGGNEFQAMIDYFQARTFNANLPEATGRMTSASTTLVANNGRNSGAREAVLSEIARRQEEARLEAERRKNIEDLLDAANAFYRAHQPFEIYMDASYSYGNIDYRNGGTVDITVSMAAAPIAEEFEVIRQLKSQAESIGHMYWPVSRRPSLLPIYGTIFMFTATFDGDRKGIWDYIIGFIGADKEEPNFTVAATIINEQGKQLKRITFHLNPSIGSGLRNNRATATVRNVKTFTIKADDLTDTLTMRIVSVNNKSVNSGYVRVPQPVVTLWATAQR